ncbi:LOW QUALITY PROTEIN: hypothetical protein V2J09_009337 [Rumex salicifolius]
MTISNESITPLQNGRGKHFATICCWFLGLGSLLAWNSMLTISDYYYQVFPKYHPSRVVTLMYQPFAVGTLIFLVWNESRIDTRKRNIAGYILFTISTFLLVVLDLASHGKGHIIDFVFLCIICGSFGVADALVQGGMVGDLSFMDPVFLQSFFCGLAASGLLTSGLRLMTKAVFENKDQGLRHGALLFMSISTSFYAFYYMQWCSLGYQLSSTIGQKQLLRAQKPCQLILLLPDESKTVEDRLSTKELILQNWDYALDLYLIYVLTLSIFPGFLYENTGKHGLGSWYPLVLIALYNCWDLISRYTPLINCLRIESRRGLLVACVARVLFIPAFYFTAKYGDQGYMLMLISLLGLTNGHLTVCVMMAYPNGYKGPEQNALGNALVVFLLGGIFTGVALDWLWIIGNGSF